VDVEAAGKSILFFSLTVGQVIICLLVLSYAVHSFLVVVEGTAAGNDQIDWPDEPFLDWVWKLFYVAALIAAWLVPLGLVLQGLASSRHVRLAPWIVGLLVTGVLWILVPLSLMCSLAGNSKWMLLHPGLLWRLVTRPGAVAVYLIISGPLLVGCAALFYCAVLQGGAGFAVLPVAGGAAAATLLIQARLLGSLAQGLSAQDSRSQKRKARTSKRPGGQETEVVDPWASPPDEHAPQEPSGEEASEEEGAYQLTDALPPPPPAEALTLPEGYSLADPLAPAVSSTPVAPHDSTEEQPSRRAPAQKRPGPAGRGTSSSPSLMIGVLAFPWRRRTLLRWLFLSFGFLLMGALLRLQISFSPFGR
jgi:hypothetical protein